jgi:hypothetical protein
MVGVMEGDGGGSPLPTCIVKVHHPLTPASAARVSRYGLGRHGKDVSGLTFPRVRW